MEMKSTSSGKNSAGKRLRVIFHFFLHFYALHFNRSSKWQNLDWEKYWRGKAIKMFIKFPHFSPSKCFLRRSFPNKVFQSGRNDKISINILSLHSSRTCYIEGFLRNYFRKKKKKSNINKISFHFFVNKHWHQWKLNHVEINIH